MPTPTIVRGSNEFFVTLYEGNGKGQRVGNFIPFTDNGTIGKSCIFTSGDSSGLSHTLSGDGDKTKFTISFWTKRGKLTGGYEALVIGGGTGGGTASAGVFFNGSNQIYTYFFGAEAITTNRTFEDTSKFYHVVVRVDTSLSTADDRVRMYVDGDQITSFATRNNPSQDATETLFNVSGKNIDIGRHSTSTNYLDGYMAEVNFADGQSYGPETFGLTDTSTGRWIPKSLSGITYGTNGFRMQFANSAGQTIGDDTSGQGNDKSVVNLAVSDITTDSPTSNFTNMGGSFDTGTTSNQGNLKVNTPSSGGGYNQVVGLPSFGVATGKWYWECRVTDNNACIVGWKDDGSNGGSQASHSGTTPPGNISGICCGSSGSFSDGELSIDTGYSGPDLGTTNNNDIFMFALDLDNQRAYIGQNGSWLNSDNPETPTAGVGGLSRIGSGNKMYPAIARLNNSATGYYNFGQNPSFNGGITAGTETPDSGPGVFKYNPPTGYLAINQDNLPTPDKGVTSFSWIKNRDAADDHAFYDSSRGPQKEWRNSETSETTLGDGLQKFLKGGFAVEDDDAINTVN